MAARFRVFVERIRHPAHQGKNYAAPSCLRINPPPPHTSQHICGSCAGLAHVWPQVQTPLGRVRRAGPALSPALGARRAARQRAHRPRRQGARPQRWPQRGQRRHLAHPVFLGSQMVAEKTNQIPAARALCERLDLTGRLVSLDAMHTQDATARAIVMGHGGDCILTVKGN